MASKAHTMLHRRLGIRARVIIGFGLLLVLIVVLAVQAATTFQSLNNVTERVIGQTFPLGNQVEALKARTNATARTAEQYFVNPSPEGRAQVREAIDDLTARTRTLEDRLTALDDPAAGKAATAMIGHLADFRRAFVSAAELRTTTVAAEATFQKSGQDIQEISRKVARGIEEDYYDALYLKDMTRLDALFPSLRLWSGLRWLTAQTRIVERDLVQDGKDAAFERLTRHLAAIERPLERLRARTTSPRRKDQVLDALLAIRSYREAADVWSTNNAMLGDDLALMRENADTLLADVATMSTALQKQVQAAGAEARAESRFARNSVTFLSAAIVLLAILVALLLERSVLPPLLSLQRTMQARARGDDRPIPTDGEDEIADMGRSFAYFVNEVESRQQALETARAEAEAASQELRHLVERLPLPMALVEGEDQRFTLINRRFRDDLGYDEDDIPTIREWWQRAYPDPDYRETVRNDWVSEVEAAVAEGREITPAEAWVTQRDGHQRLFQFYAAPVRDKMTVVLVDITALRETEAQLKEAIRQAENANAAKSEFLANMSHEIRTPMNAVLGLSHLLRRQELTPRQRDQIEKIHAAGSSLLGIINDLLDFSKIEAGKLELEQADFQIDAVLSHVASVTSLRADEKDIELLFHTAPDVPRVLRGDSARLGQMLLNLVNNAIKFTDEGEVVVTVALARRAQGCAWVRFAVRDTGAGMTAAQQAKLFQPFSQADTSTTRRFGGTGLGLAICRQFTELMGGEIGLDSAPGQGSTFHFTVPLGISAEPRRVASTTLQGLRVLVVDDNGTAREVLTGILDSWEMSVTVARSGREALDIVRQSERPFDLVLMDWRMPEMDGIQATEAIRRSAPPDQAPPTVIMVTAHGREDVLTRAETLGIEHVLMKPVQESILFDAIAEVFARDGAAPSGAARSEAGPAAAPEPAALQGAHVLLAEDNAVNQEVARDLLEEAGLRVDIAHNGREAVDAVLAPAARFDAVLMDVQMPVLDGLDATREIRAVKDSATLPVIAMTAHAMAHERDRCLQAGMDDHIGKPVDPDQMTAVLLRWIKPGGGAAADPAGTPAAPAPPPETVPAEAAPETTAPKPSQPAATGASAEGGAVSGGGAEGGDGDLPALPGVNLDGLRRRAGRKPGRAWKLLRLFAREYGEVESAIAARVEAEDWADLARLAHGLKSGAGNVGAQTLSEAAATLERAARDVREADARAAAESTRAYLREVLDGLADALDEPR